MKKAKRILAIIGVILLVAMYALTLISVLIDTPYSESLFKASIFSTIAVPIFIYGVMLVYRLMKGKSEEPNSEDSKSRESESKESKSGS